MNPPDNPLRETIERVLSGVHIEDGTTAAWNRVVDNLEREISIRVRSHEIDFYTEDKTWK
jgi:hypothetical protein